MEELEEWWEWDPKQYKLNGGMVGSQSGVVGSQTIHIKWRSGGVGGIPNKLNPNQEWWDPKQVKWRSGGIPNNTHFKSGGVVEWVESQTIQVKFIIKLK